MMTISARKSSLATKPVLILPAETDKRYAKTLKTREE